MEPVEIISQRALGATHYRHPDAVATGTARSGPVLFGYCLLLDGSVRLPPSVHLDADAYEDLRRVAQAIQIIRLARPETQATWFEGGRA